jgi:hypothetical protein
VELIDRLARVPAWLMGLPVHTKVLLGLATSMFLTELAFRRFAPRSSAYKKWTAGIEALGAFWTAIILGIVYFVSVALISLGMRLTGHDPLDRRLAKEPSFWRRHEPNPLGPDAAARHQF